MANIYSIDNWASSTLYIKHSIVLYNSRYYYSFIDHTSSSSFITDLSAGKWVGVLNYNNEDKPYFTWSPDYGYSFDIQPIVNTIQFGDGYAQDINNNLNNTLLKIDMSFNDRNIKEYTAILHFLHTRSGSEKFFFVPPSPYSVVKKFICKNWTPSQQFYDRYSIKVQFEERV